MSIKRPAIGFTKLRLQRLEHRRMLTGDFNGDGILDVQDIDLLSTAISDGVVEVAYDINGDHDVNLHDVDEWLSHAAQQHGWSTPYLVGDLNLDGRVDSKDLNRLGENWQQTDAAWSSGDINSDGKVSSGDLTLLGSNWRSTNRDTSTAVELYLGEDGLSEIIADDFNGDGFADLAVSHGGREGGVSILTGGPYGQYNDPEIYSISSPTYMLATHVNHDSFIDLVTVTSLGQVSTLLGRGNGTFENGPETSLATFVVSSVVAHDMNGDDKIDLVLTRNSLSEVIIAFGDGDGSFSETTEIDGGLGSISILAEDFNNDGSADIAVAYQSEEGAGLRIHTANDDGSYSLQDMSIDLDGERVFATSFVAADANNDGSVDLFLGTNHSVILLQNNGDGTFNNDQQIAMQFWSNSIDVIDIDANGTLDLVSVDFVDSQIEVHYGETDGTFAEPISFFAGDSPEELAIADLDNDGRLDVATLNPRDKSIAILYGQSMGGLGELYSTGDGPKSITSADINGDGALDLVTLNERSNDASVLLGVGDGTFSQPETIGGIAGRPVKIESVDLPDSSALMTVTSQGLRLFSLGPGHSFDDPIVVVDDTVSAAWAGDINGDGQVDIAYSRNGSVFVQIGQGDGSFAAPTEIELVPLPGFGFFPGDIVAGDFNGDGTVDLAVSNELPFAESVVVLWGSNGNELFDGTQRLQIGNVHSLDVADVNEDGKSDLLAKSLFSPQVSVLLGASDGRFILADPIELSPFTFSTIQVADVNGDGKDDLISMDQTSDTIEIFLANAEGKYSSSTKLSVAGPPTEITVGDFDHDGILDLAVSNEESDAISVLLGNGDGTFKDATHYGTSTTTTTPRARRLALQRRLW